MRVFHEFLQSQSSLSEHFVSKHSGVKFECDVCRKEFGNRALLKVHR